MNIPKEYVDFIQSIITKLEQMAQEHPDLRNRCIKLKESFQADLNKIKTRI